MRGCSFLESGNTSLCQRVPVIIVSVEACGTARFVSRGDKGTDKPDSSAMKVREARCQAAGRGIGFYLFYALNLLQIYKYI